MRKVLSTFQDSALKANREETRALILASKKSAKTTNVLEPANSALRLLHKVLEEAGVWLNARGYLSATVKVHLS